MCPDQVVDLSSALAVPNGPRPHQSFRDAIAKWEAEWEDDRNDRGNYAHCWDGTTRLIGTMRGVTPDVYAKFRGVDPATLTAAAMQTDITLDVAAEVAIEMFYKQPGFCDLTWSPVVAIAVDVAWSSGVHLGVSMLQQVIGAVSDGNLGPQTRHALDASVEAHGADSVCADFVARRTQFYQSISAPGSLNARFRSGWLTRAEWFSPTNPDWWSPWRSWTLQVPVASKKPTGFPPASTAQL